MRGSGLALRAAALMPGPRARHHRSRLLGPLLITTFLLPYLIVLSLGFGFAVVSAIWVSLTGGQYFAEAYQALGDDQVFWESMARTVTQSAFISLMCVLIAYPTAEFINRSSVRWQPVLLAAVFIPLWSSTVARTYGWVGIFIKDGLLDRIANAFGVGPLHVLYTQPAVFVGMVHVMLPLSLLAIYVAVRRYDQRLSRASLSLGAGRFRTFLFVRLPVLAPVIVTSAVAVFILSVGFYVTPAVLGQPSSQFVSNLIGQQVQQRFDMPRAGAMSILLLGAVLLALALAALGARVYSRSQR